MSEFFFEVKEKFQTKITLKMELAKGRQKPFFVLFSNACSILEFMLCNRNLTKLVYQTLLSSNCSA